MISRRDFIQMSLKQGAGFAAASFVLAFGSIAWTAAEKKVAGEWTSPSPTALPSPSGASGSR